MNSIPKVSLEDTLYLIQMMRETALTQGNQAQASRLTPIESQMRGLVSNSHQAQTSPAPASGILGQSDFKKLLEVTQNKSAAASAPTANAALERNRMIQAMSAANMSEIDIARNFGATREEVRLVLNAQSKGSQ
jgi:hypothetical protein